MRSSSHVRFRIFSNITSVKSTGNFHMARPLRQRRTVHQASRAPRAACRAGQIMSVGGGRFESWAGAPFDRGLVRLIVALLDNDGLHHRLLRRRLLAYGAHGDLGRDTSLTESIVVTA